MANAYVRPFPRELKFETWLYGVGESGLIGAQASDFENPRHSLRNVPQSRLGKPAPTTIENHDVSQRY